MPVQSNFAIQNLPRVMFDGTTHRSIDVRKHVGFAFSFEVTADIVTDAVFNIEAAAPDAADNCAPGAFTAVPEVATCAGEAVGGQATVTIPAGAKAGSIYTGTIACRSGSFIRMQSASGDTANVLIAAVLHGPKM